MAEHQAAPEPAHQNHGSGIKLLIELGPLLVFFLTYWAFGIRSATAVLMAGTVLAIVASKVVLGKVSPMPMFTAAIVCIFGGLTLWLNDPSFIKMKPTIVNLVFAGLLGGGLMFGRPFIKVLLGEQIQLTDKGWHHLTIQWIVFFIVMAAVNELIWRNFSEATWVAFKVFGILPITAVFAVVQLMFLQRYHTPR